MDLIDDYVLTNLTVSQGLEVQYKLRSLGDEWRNDPYKHNDGLNILMKSKPLFRCERCMKTIKDIHAHMNEHIDEDIKAGVIKDEEDEPSLECPNCGQLMQMTDEDIPHCMPLKCKCGYKRTVKMYSDGRYLII